MVPGITPTHLERRDFTMSAGPVIPMASFYWVAIVIMLNGQQNYCQKHHQQQHLNLHCHMMLGKGEFAMYIIGWWQGGANENFTNYKNSGLIFVYFWLFIKYVNSEKCLYYREACGIELPDSENLVVTGGDRSTRVVMYSAQGSAMELPSLQQQRRRHGCGFYYNDDQLVTLRYIFTLLL